MTEYIDKTVKELGAVISSPKLTEKLLSKPPFRFIHDVVASFLKTTGFPAGLYSEDMLDRDKVTDKEVKIEFLRLLIAAIDAATGKTCDAKPQKIVAGQEPEHTNQMFQLLASCASLSVEKKAAAVAKVTGGSSATPVAQLAKASAEEKSSKDDEERRKAKEEKRRREKEREKEKEKEREGEQKTPSSSAKREETDEERRKRHEERKREKEQQREKERADEVRRGAAKDRDKEEERRKRHSEKKREDDAHHTSHSASVVPAAEATTTAGKAPPRTKPTHEVMVTNSAVDATPATGVIREAKRGERVDEDEEAAEDWQRVAEMYQVKPKSATSAVADDATVKGALGQQALQAKRSQEEAARQAEVAALNAPRDGGIVIRSSKKGTSRESGHAMGEGELSKLREQLQLLTKASNPLGKFLEVIHDDIDSMTRELEMWRGEARSQAFAAAEAQHQTEENLKEIHAQLQNLEDSINDQILKTNHLRQNIISNDAAIQGMLKMVVHPEIANRQ